MENELKVIIRKTLNDETVIEKGKKLVEIIEEYVSSRHGSKTIDERRKDLLDLLRADNNLLESSTLSELIKKEVVSNDQLKALGIDEKFITALQADLKRPKLVTENDSKEKGTSQLERISKKSTEVYFWGIPSSGKTCAIGAILSMIGSGNSAFAKSFYMDPNCQGYEYMMRLKSIFNTNKDVTIKDVAMLPAGNAIKATYEMGFDLIDNDYNSHPITLIDMAGELIRIMFKSNTKKDLRDDEKESLKVVDNILTENRSENRKLHFFVLEYGGENRQYENLSQDSYLTAAMNYLIDKGVFETETDGIYLLITKADNSNVEDGKLQKHIVDYIETKGYKGFCKALKGLCTKNNIKDGKLEIIPFSLGQVCFKDYCLFDSEYTDDVIKILVRDTWSYSWLRNKWWGRCILWFGNLLKK